MARDIGTVCGNAACGHVDDETDVCGAQIAITVFCGPSAAAGGSDDDDRRVYQLMRRGRARRGPDRCVLVRSARDRR